MQMRLNHTESMLTGLKAASQDARDRLASMSKEFQTMQEQLTAANNQSAEFEAAIQARDAEITRLKNILQTREAEQAQLQQKIEAGKDLQQETQVLKTDLQKLQQELQGRNESLATAKEKITQLEQQLGKTARLEEELKTCQAGREEASQRIAELETENQKLKTTLEETRQAQAKLEKMHSDSDGDGVSDAIDICPHTGAGLKVNAKGCEPDTDLDGLVDRLDLCPHTPEGKEIDAVGCHADETITLEGVNFQSGSADFTDESLAVLDRIAEILKQNSALNIEVAGHTDNTGPRELNIELSATRANAVKNYLIEQGIAPERLTAYGYGPDQPVASNATPEGRAQNRRVELRRK